MIAISSLSGCQPVTAATAVVGCLLSCAGAFAQSSEVQGDPSGMGGHTVSIGSRLAQFEFQPLHRPRKRPFYLELYGAKIERPKRRMSVFANAGGSLASEMTIMRRPGGLPWEEFLPLRETDGPEADGPSVTNLTGRQFMDLVEVDIDTGPEPDGSVADHSEPMAHPAAAAVVAGHDLQLAAAQPYGPFRVSRFQMAEPLMPGGRPKRRSSSIEELVCLADVIYFEARGEGLAGRHAVAMTVLNRVGSKRFPNTICAVVKQGKGELHKCQFSYYCDGLPEKIHELQAYLKIKELARNILDSGAADRTGGATYFHTVSVSPSWADEMQMTAKIGHHVFYREPN